MHITEHYTQLPIIIYIYIYIYLCVCGILISIIGLYVCWVCFFTPSKCSHYIQNMSPKSFFFTKHNPREFTHMSKNTLRIFFDNIINVYIYWSLSSRFSSNRCLNKKNIINHYIYNQCTHIRISTRQNPIITTYSYFHF